MGTELFIPTVRASSVARCSPAETDAMLETEWISRHGFISPVEHAVHSKHGFDMRLVGFEPPPTRDPELLEKIEAACRPASPDVITAELARLRVATAGRVLSGVSMAAWLAVLGEELERYPADVVREACRRWARREKWTPSVAELVEECERLMARRRALLAAVRKTPVSQAPETPRHKPSKDEQQRVTDYVNAAVKALRASDGPNACSMGPDLARHHRPDPARMRRVLEETRGMKLVGRGGDDEPE